tara:strand:+ start:65 stop:517 length:453 start_codon:yes stop_codon:yes gene_type:complete
MNLKLQKELASKITGAGKSRIVINSAEADKVKEAITKADVRDLIDQKVITIKAAKSNSRVRARLRVIAKKKGRQRGPAKKSGRKTARSKPKDNWISRVRLQRKLLKSFKSRGLITSSTWKNLYLKSKGGFFRHKRQMLQYMEQNKLFNKK